MVQIKGRSAFPEQSGTGNENIYLGLQFQDAHIAEEKN